MADIVERLRHPNGPKTYPIRFEAADEIERLRTENQDLETSINATLDHARTVAGRRDVHSVEEVLDALCADSASWEQQASDRLDDAVRFAAERDAARAEVEALRNCLATASSCIKAVGQWEHHGHSVREAWGADDWDALICAISEQALQIQEAL